MRQSNSSETSPVMSAHEGNFNKESEAEIFTQEEIDEHIRNCIASLNKHC